jgi:hypothetical protein
MNEKDVNQESLRYHGYEDVFKRSSGELMGEIVELVKEDRDVSSATLSGMFRMMAEGFYHGGVDVGPSKKLAEETFMHLAHALDICEDPSDPATYNDALERLNDKKQKGHFAPQPGKYSTAIIRAIAKGST